MLLLVLLVAFEAIAAAGASPNEPRADLERYWAREFDCREPAEHYELVVAVEDVSEAANRVDEIFSAEGVPKGTRAGISMNYGSGDFRGFNIQGSFPIAGGEATAKKLTNLGELISYSAKRKPILAEVRAVKERVEVLEHDLSLGRDILPGLPAARFFLMSRLAALRQMRAKCEGASSSAGVSISVVRPPAGWRT